MIGSTGRVALRPRAAPSSVARLYSASAPASQKYDVVVVGGGPGGYVAAIKASQLGLKTVCVESRGTLGGTCLNVGCIPSKALLHSSHMYEHAKKDFAHHGIKIDGTISMDVKQMMANKTKAVGALTGGIEFLFKKYKVDYVKGFGKLTGPNSVSVALNAGGEQTIESKNIILAVGSEVTPLPPVPVDNKGKKIVDSTGALDLEKLPSSMVVIGGGVIGLEMGSVWARLGTKVTVVEFLDTITPSLDTETSKNFQKILKKQGLKFMMSTKVTKSEVAGETVKLTVEPAAGGAASQLEADVVLVSTGRRPFTRNIGLEGLGIKTDKVGRIEVNEHFQTAVPSVYAIGDAIDGPMLAHKAEEEGIACVENIAGFAGHVNYNCIPGVIYTHPEVATVGQTEEQLKKANVAYNKGVFPFSANSRARATGMYGRLNFLHRRSLSLALSLSLSSSSSTSSSLHAPHIIPSYPAQQNPPQATSRAWSRFWPTRRRTASWACTSSAPTLAR